MKPIWQLSLTYKGYLKLTGPLDHEIELGGVIATAQGTRDRIITWSKKMATTIQQTQAALVKAITDIAAAIPLARTVQLYQFARFLKTHPLPTEETFEEIAADEAIWDAQFAATDNGKLAALVAAVEAEINEGKTLPMFDEHGEFIEHK